MQLGASCAETTPARHKQAGVVSYTSASVFGGISESLVWEWSGWR